MSVGARLGCVLAMVLAVGPGEVRAQEPSNAEWRRVAPGLNEPFPDAHRSHPDYRLEWWYYTGNLEAADGRRLGFQLTFFRVGVDREPVNPSRWAIRDLHVAHLAVTDEDGRAFHHAERMNRAGVGLAGAAIDRYRVWNDDWEARLDDDGRHRLRAVADEIGVDLTLEESSRPVWHGVAGYSQKGEEEGNATQYYSIPRLHTTGRVMVGGAWAEVSGVSWMDHEYGTSFLEAEQVGWDWFSLQLSTGASLMVFRLRRGDGLDDPHSAGTFIRADGSTLALDAGAFVVAPVATWTSPKSGATYPVRWRLTVPELDIEVDVRALLDSQELVTKVTGGVVYWEGAIRAAGRTGGVEATGVGYLEMTGYAGPPMSSVLR